ncbi:MAG TPA: alpha/beta hydrolase [Stellaceae bacterium]|nr:alpha/beta hydrolase [Stellaceae bacterium]
MPSPGILARKGGATIAYRRLAGAAPGTVFLGGLRSDMTGTKALFLEDYCRRRRRAFVRFDYFGHGRSSGEFEAGTIGRWTEDALAVLDELTQGPQVLVGSSMGGWVMLLAALARPERVAALVGIAPAADFTQALWERLTEDERTTCARDGFVRLPSEYDPAGYLYSHALFEDGKRHLLLGAPIPIASPVRLFHGMRDAAVPWQRSLALAERLQSRDVVVGLVKEGDHRLSTEADLARLAATLDGLSGPR